MRKAHQIDIPDLGTPDLGMLSQLWRYRAYARRHLRPLLGGVALRFVELTCDLAKPWPLALVIDHVIKGTKPGGFLGEMAAVFGSSPIAMLSAAACGVLVISLLSGLFDYLGDRMMNSAGERITSEIRTEVFSHMQRLPMGYHDKQAVGELTSRIATDTSRIEDGMVEMFSTLIPGLISMVGFAAVLLAVNWRLGLVALAVAPLVFFTAARYTKLTRNAARRRRAAEGKMAGLVAESLQGARTVHAFGRQDEHDRKFKTANQVVLGTGLRAVDLRARFTPLLESVTAIGTAALLFVGGYGVLNGLWTVGVLVVVTSYLRDMLKPLRAMSKLALTFTRGAASAERIAAVLDSPRRLVTPRLDPPARIDGAVELRGVALDYGRGPILNEIDLRIRPGDRVALLGPNGAGKSSILALISGLYEPSEGTVLVGGIPMSEVRDSWLHRQVSVVLQDTFLFSGTLADNIRYGRLDASDAEVRAVAEAALVTDFSSQLPDGLETTLDFGGVGLSGGQRQRVGIARALLVDAPVVLLDEPTTGLDADAERTVVQALGRLAHGRTVVMITHRPAIIQLATRVLHLKQGKITETSLSTPRVPMAKRIGPPAGRGTGAWQSQTGAHAPRSVAPAGRQPAPMPGQHSQLDSRTTQIPPPRPRRESQYRWGEWFADTPRASKGDTNGDPDASVNGDPDASVNGHTDGCVNGHTDGHRDGR